MSNEVNHRLTFFRGGMLRDDLVPELWRVNIGQEGRHSSTATEIAKRPPPTLALQFGYLSPLAHTSRPALESSYTRRSQTNSVVVQAPRPTTNPMSPIARVTRTELPR